MTEILWDAALDCVKILPFLFLSYLAVEYTEHRMSQKTKNWIYRAGKAGPVLGGLIGIIPQCGFSAAAAGLFAGGIVTPGTLIAVFLSTSVDLVAENLLGMKREIPETQEMCEHEHCHCSEHGIFRSALNHTAQITVFLFVISVVLGFGMEYLQEHGVAQSFLAVPGLEEAAAALVGMIPNCAASVLITQLYISGFLGSGALFAGLLCGAGTGLLVLFRENQNRRESLILTGVLYVSGVLAGILLGMMHIL